MRTSLLALLVAAACSQPNKDRREGGGETPPTPDRAAPAPADAAEAPTPAPPAEPPAGDATLGKPPAELAAALALREVSDDFVRPVALEVAPGDATGTLYVVEQSGRIWTLDAAGKKSAKPVYDNRRAITRGGNEQGLLGLAFHPKFATNNKLYVNFTDTDGATNVVEYRMSGGKVDMSTGRTLLEVRQPFSNHNAGDLEFGPDGKLWIGLGDGGAGGDPMGAGQSDSNKLGKMLRMDVDAAEPKAEIAIKGVRNPWRYHFDPRAGDLYIADVGQNKWEEVDVIPRGRWDGVNLGWNIMEATHCFKPSSGCKRDGLTLPVVEYSHDEGCSITGGEVYRGKAIPALDGVYFYADYCEPGIIRSFRWTASTGVRDHWDWTDALVDDAGVKEISSFGHDANGELYLVSLRGAIYKLVRK
jgi:glucose/arabinose dehydrogenase